MKTIFPYPYPLKSQISISIVVLGVLTPLLIFTAAIILILAVRKEGFEEISLAWIIHLFWLFPLLALAAVISGYSVLTVEKDKVTERRLWKQREFLRSDITGYAERYRYRQGKRLLLELRGGEQIQIHSSYYRNYQVLKEALTEGVEAQPALAATLNREENKRLLVWGALAFGAGLLYVLVIQYNLQKLPLKAGDLQPLQLMLAEKPRVQLETKEGDTLITRVALATREYPGVEFQLKGSALYAARAEELTHQLHTGDHVRLLADRKDYYYAVTRNDHPAVRLQAVDVYALRSKGTELLTLRAYNAERQAQLEYERNMLGLGLCIIGLFLGWRGWVYLSET
ncbi:MAG: hypothetical protein KDC75_10535 [Phaeodactylibacter sp.]|nr:hypothetical protein [Phaeodactylibacter sp.]